MSKDDYDRAGKELTFKRISEEQGALITISGIAGFWWPLAWIVTAASFVYLIVKYSELRD